jgi:hypothetical protein
MASETENGTKGRELLLGLSITSLLTAFGYLITYVATVARASYFHVPLDYVVVGATQIVGAAAWSLLACSLVLPVLVSLEIASSLSETPTSPERPIVGFVREEWVKVLLVVILCVLGSGLVLFFSGLVKVSNPLAVCGYLAFLVAIVALVLYQRRTKAKQGRYKVISSVYSYILILTVIACAVASYLGNSGAASQVGFDIIDDPGRTYNGYAVMWTSNDILVLAFVDTATRCFGDHFATVKLEGENAAMTWRYRDKIGPLTYCSKPPQVAKNK